MSDGIIARVLGWLRAGYPQGVPQQDYFALLGVLRRSLTEDEVAQVAGIVREGGDPCDDAIRDSIRGHLLQSASEDDVRRVVDHLAEGGWPADVDDEGRRTLREDVTS